MIHYLYLATCKMKLLNECMRKAIIMFELPLLKSIFLFAGANVVIARNSVYEPNKFNVFMSDLDFTLVSSERKFEFLYKIKKNLQKIFLNVGEIELYTPDEWAECEELSHSPHMIYWTKINTIRKSAWQRKKLASAKSVHEVAKQKRALEITLNRLGQDRFPIDGASVFKELPGHLNESNFGLPTYSSFLEYKITTKVEEDVCYFSNIQTAVRLISILPDNTIVPEDKTLREIKLFLLRKEFLMTTTSLRVNKLLTPEKDFPEHVHWLGDLKEKIIQNR